MKLLVQFPTRERKDLFFSVLNDYYSKAKNLDLCHFHIVIDENDKSMNDPNVIKALGGMKNCTYTLSNTSGKIQAINTLPSLQWDILLLASDDMIVQCQDWDENIRGKMKEHFPDTDGVLWYNDGYAKDKLNTLVCMGKKYYDRFGYIYHPSYKSLWCDNEFTDVANSLKKQIYFSECIIKHEHPANTNKRSFDNLYAKNESSYQTDKQNYEERKSLDFPRVLLTIMICTIPERKDMFDLLIQKLKMQITQEKVQNFVEILYCSENDPIVTIGQKRNTLMQSANGEYVCFIDDDDDISDDYIKLVFSAIQKKPDCLSLKGIITIDGKDPKEFIHSLRYSSYFTKHNTFFRPPNHLNVIKKSLIKRFKFPEKNFGEDTDWAMQVCKKKALKHEIEIPSILYFYKFRTTK